MTIDSTPKDLANSSLLRWASYSTSLLVVWYYRRVVYFNLSPSEDFNTTPVPLAYSVDDPSTWMIHALVLFSSSKSTWLGVNSAMKSTRA